MIRRPPRSTLFPYTRSSDLPTTVISLMGIEELRGVRNAERGTAVGAAITLTELQDRKSTRLNSSHSQISYAVFCLKKKKKQEPRTNALYCSLPDDARSSHWS